jgi:hypothetical protein
MEEESGEAGNEIVAVADRDRRERPQARGAERERSDRDASDRLAAAVAGRGKCRVCLDSPKDFSPHLPCDCECCEVCSVWSVSAASSRAHALCCDCKSDIRCSCCGAPLLSVSVVGCMCVCVCVLLCVFPPSLSLSRTVPVVPFAALSLVDGTRMTVSSFAWSSFCQRTFTVVVGGCMLVGLISFGFFQECCEHHFTSRVQEGSIRALTCPVCVLPVGPESVGVDVCVCV